MKVLFIGDPNLGDQGLEIVRRYYADVTAINYIKGNESSKQQAQAVIRKDRSKKWDLVVSFYSDLVLEDEDLLYMHVVFNIHPGAPHVPGMGYDTVPLLESHEYHEVTAHFIPDRRIDAGTIIAVEGQPLALTTTYAQLRRANQSLCLMLLVRMMEMVKECTDHCAVRDLYEAAAHNLRRYWSGRKLKTASVSQMLEELFQKDPAHRVFVGHPKFGKK